MSRSNPSTHVGSGASSGTKDYLAIALGWLIPGAGHWLIGQRGRAVVFALAIHLLFFGGVLLGGVRVLNRPRQPVWDYSQFMAGWPMLVGNAVKNNTFPPHAKHPVGFAPLIQDVATAYCGLAGMLNLLVLVDLFLHVSDDHSPPKTIVVPPSATGGEK